MVLEFVGVHFTRPAPTTLSILLFPEERTAENGEDVFPSAPEPSAVSGRPDNTRIFDRFLTDTVRQRCPQVYSRLRSSAVPLALAVAPQMARCVRARAARMCGGIRTRPIGMQLDFHAFDAAVH